MTLGLYDRERRRRRQAVVGVAKILLLLGFLGAGCAFAYQIGVEQTKGRNEQLAADVERLALENQGSDEQASAHVADQVMLALRAKTAGIELRRTEFVGPQVGAELAESGFLALLYTFAGILIYVGLRFEHRFLHPWLLLEAEVNRRSQAFASVTETFFTAEAGLGVKALENRLALIPFVRLERSDLPSKPAFEPLPVRLGPSLTLDVGAEARAELSVRDAERIVYLGLDTSVRYAHAGAWLGTDITRDLLDVQSALNLPLFENDRGAHAILRLTGRFAQLFDGDDVPAHDELAQDHGADEAEQADQQRDLEVALVGQPQPEHHQQRQRVHVQRVQRQHAVGQAGPAQQAPRVEHQRERERGQHPGQHRGQDRGQVRHSKISTSGAS